jgi:hypothetical protein
VFLKSRHETSPSCKNESDSHPSQPTYLPQVAHGTAKTVRSNQEAGFSSISCYGERNENSRNRAEKIPRLPFASAVRIVTAQRVALYGGFASSLQRIVGTVERDFVPIGEREAKQLFPFSAHPVKLPP